MKKLILAVILVALLAAAVFGGQALASSKPADVTVSEETASILGSSYWGYPLRIKTLSGTAVIDNDSETILEENYPGVRHVSLTIYVEGYTLNPDFIHLIITPLTWTGGNKIIEVMGADYHETYEFNTDNWGLEVIDGDGNPIELSYWATITYPSNQW